MNTILQFDGFAEDIEQIRASVVNGEFTTQTGPDGAPYTGISMFPVPHWPRNIEKCLGVPIIPRLSCFRLNLEGELPHSWVHSDDICAKYASVLYLNEPEQCKGGTAFWTHKALNIDRLPSKENLTKQGIDADSFYKRMEREWKELIWWKQRIFVPMQFNRFITYPTYLFHSRFPFEGFGKGPQDGRLIWICFYDLAEEMPS
jgi:hypothetical protein